MKWSVKDNIYTASEEVADKMPPGYYEVKHNGVLLNPKNFIFSDIKIFELLTEKGYN